MDRMNVNPTRMMLTTLKRRLATATRGHKLMKDKRDQLMKNFLVQAKETGELRKEVEDELALMYKDYEKASSIISREILEESLMFTKMGVNIDVETKNIMSVEVPEFTFTRTSDNTGDAFAYGFARTSGELDKAITSSADVFPKMLRLAASEKKTQLMAAELEKTRRRVNALEYVMIPKLEVTIRYITMKLDENERGNQTRLMKVKDMMLQEAIQEKREKTEEALEQFADGN